MLLQKRIWRGRREFIYVRVAGKGGASVGDETRLALQAAIEAIERAGFSPDHLTRSRLWAIDPAARAEASDIRRTFLAGSLRAASASFWGPEHLPAGSRVMIDLAALRPTAGATKAVVEYVPAITPPAFVTLDGMVFLSGNTDQSPGLEAQVAAIAGKIRGSLAQARSSVRRDRDIVGLSRRDREPGCGACGHPTRLARPELSCSHCNGPRVLGAG